MDSGGGRRTWIRATAMAITTAALAGGAAAQVAGPGLAAPGANAASPWPTLQLRLVPSVRGPLAVVPSGSVLGSALVADLYLSPSGLGPRVQGGLRATSGLIARPAGGGLLPGSATGSEHGGTLPYLGFGYSGLHLPTGWSLAADLGLVATTPGAARLGRSSFTSSAAVEDLVRDLRLAPVLRLGVSYAF